MIGKEKKKNRTVLLTTLFSLSAKQMNYCVMQPSDWHRQYCNMVIPAEASAKQVLSLTPIDEIVVIGEKSTAYDNEYNKTFKIYEFEDSCDMREGRYSQFGFFCYRMKQYLKNEDAEMEKLLDSIPVERQDEIIRAYRERFKLDKISEKDQSLKRDRYFDVIQNLDKQDITDAVIMRDLEITPEEGEWLIANGYDRMTDSLKCIALDSNMDVKVRFVPSSADVISSTDNIHSIIKAIYTGDDNVGIIADMHSLNITDAYSIINVMAMITNLYPDNLTVESMLCVDYNTLVTRPAALLYDWRERFSISELVAAVDTFKEYGKAAPLEEYWKEHGEENPLIDKIIYAMKSIDTGLSLCDVTEMEYGIAQLKKALKETDNIPEIQESGFATKVFFTLTKGILMDYGTLLTSDEPQLLDLLKWCEKKRLYQQAMTLIESKFPEYLASSGIFYYAKNKDDSEKVKDALTFQYYRDPPFTRYAFKEIDHYMVKSYARGIMRRNGGKDEKSISYAEFMKQRVIMGRAKEAGENYSVDESLFDRRDYEEYTPDILNAYSLLDDLELLKDLLITYYFIGNVRNSINHASDNARIDFSDSREVGDSLRLRMVTQLIAHFIKQLEKANNGIQGKVNDGYRISGQEFQEYAFSHKPQKDYSGKRKNPNPAEKTEDRADTGDNKVNKGDKGNTGGPKIVGNIRSILNKNTAK